VPLDLREPCHFTCTRQFAAQSGAGELSMRTTPVGRWLDLRSLGCRGVGAGTLERAIDGGACDAEELGEVGAS